MERATIQNRSLSESERQGLKQNARKITGLKTERRSASPSRRSVIDAELRSLNARCEAIVGGV